MSITVKELIQKLQDLPEEQKDFKVEVEGCDCTGIADGIQVNKTYQTVMVTREN